MAEDPNTWDVETRLVRGGMSRTPYGEISEALFLNQSFAYESAQAADERFAGTARSGVSFDTRCSASRWRPVRWRSSLLPRAPATALKMKIRRS